jgi:hypothetical protein
MSKTITKSANFLRAAALSSSLFVLAGCKATQQTPTGETVTGPFPAINYGVPGTINPKDYPHLSEPNRKSLDHLNRMVTESAMVIQAALDGRCEDVEVIEKKFFENTNGIKMFEFEFEEQGSQELREKVLSAARIRQLAVGIVKDRCLINRAVEKYEI